MSRAAGQILRRALQGLFAVKIPSSIATVSTAQSAKLERRRSEASDLLKREERRIDMPDSALRRVTLQEALDARSPEQQRVEHGLDEYPRRDGAIIQPLAHHRHPWKRSKFDHFRPRAPGAFDR